ncbi:glycosyltransferase [Methanosarcina horonobensis]|uniref:glycosyltransferase n=1 Tax=Methanosarcina horonobensis TaxID=418008 RepID=UPI0022B8CA45|nr:glycosyltransferase [Methanosarcina horonobensis]
MPNAQLIIVGKHYENDYSNKLKTKKRIALSFFVENVSDEDLPFYYAACDVYATCSLLEGFNMPLVEAQACGKPVVAFNIGPHKEVVKKWFFS